ncbi:hypothetical protein [Cryptosporangium sp. NPDC051539]|uniref:hypothetical protein n=1 Tax=Cryptosporangium sp. NPDC051539 TaxID=3363962 RepID=UPI0037B17CB3
MRPVNVRPARTGKTDFDAIETVPVSIPQAVVVVLTALSLTRATRCYRRVAA